MKISVLSVDLKRSLNLVFRGISSKPHLPILSGILLRVKDSQVSVESTDLEMSFWVSIPASVESEGSLVVPAKLFVDLVGSFVGEKVELESIDNKLVVKTKGVTSELVCQSVEDFPVIPRLKAAVIRIESSDFKKKMEKVNVSTAKEDTRPILTGVLWEFKETETLLVATDGFRLSMERVVPETKNSENLLNKKYIIPSKALLEVSKAVSDFGAIDFGIEFDDKGRQVIFSLGSLEISSRLLEGEFPPYQQIIPNTYNTKVNVPKDELLSAVKRASLFARDNANVIKIQIEEGTVSVSAENSQIGSNVTKVESEVEGEKILMAFNAKYLIDYLSVVEGDFVEWETEGELKPSVLKDNKNMSWLQVIMPIRVQS